MYSNKLATYLFITLVVFVTSACKKNEPSDLQKDSFAKSFGGSFADESIDILEDDNNFYILGTVRDQNDSIKIFLTKTDEFGNNIWDTPKIYPNGNKNAKGSQIIKLKHNDGFAILGSIETDNDSLYFDTHVTIINNDGDIIKDTTYHVLDTDFEQKKETAICLVELASGELFISSNIYTPSNNTFLKNTSIIIDYNLTIKRRSTLDIEINSICEKKTDNGFFISGNVYSTGGNGEIITGFAQYNEDGGFLSFAKLSEIEGSITSITQNSNGDTYICGILNQNNGLNTNGFIAKLTDPDASIQTDWLIPYNYKVNGKDEFIGNDNFSFMQITDQNELILTGITEHSDDLYDIWVIKTDEIGNKLYEKTFGGTDNEQGVKIIPLDDEKYIVLSTNSYSKNSTISILKSHY